MSTLDHLKPSEHVPLIAIVGRPNVGKSTLFNRLTKKWQSIVEDFPGITRDRLTARFEAFGHKLELMDTGGLNFAPKSAVEKKMSAQAMIGVNEANLIVFVMDGREGLNPADRDWADKIRRLGKPTLFIINKIDSEKLEPQKADFYELGVDVFDISAEKQRHLVELTQLMIQKLDLKQETSFDSMLKNPHKRGKVFGKRGKTNKIIPEDESDEVAPLDLSEDTTTRQSESILDRPLNVAIIGRPNVGKSTLLNAILGEERCVVDDVPGTTRDSIHTYVTIDGKDYCLIDTAGIRKRARTTSRVEKFSVMSALATIDQADMVLFLIDGKEGPTDQDAHVAGYAFEKQKAMLVLVNKWDEGHHKYTLDQFKDRLEFKMNYLKNCPVLYISAKTKKNLPKIFTALEGVRDQYFKQVKTGELNTAFAEIIDHHPLPSFNGRDIRMKYTTQVGVAPPSFVVFCSDPEHVHFSYKRYLTNALRQYFELPHVPIRLIFKNKK